MEITKCDRDGNMLTLDIKGGMRVSLLQVKKMAEEHLEPEENIKEVWALSYTYFQSEGYGTGYAIMVIEGGDEE